MAKTFLLGLLSSLQGPRGVLLEPVAAACVFGRRTGAFPFRDFKYLPGGHLGVGGSLIGLTVVEGVELSHFSVGGERGEVSIVGSLIGFAVMVVGMFFAISVIVTPCGASRKTL